LGHKLRKARDGGKEIECNFNDIQRKKKKEYIQQKRKT
jgi:hypothetical protein